MMSAMLTGNEWVDAMDRHYFAEYVPAGGAAIKFAICYPGVDQRAVANRLRSQGTSRGFLVADIDSTLTKVHLVEQLFGRIADQIPWDEITDRCLAKFARENQWKVPESFLDEGIVDQLDRLNQLGTQQVSLVLQRQIGERILLNRKFAKDFRVAMHWLARARLDSRLRGTETYQQLTDWLGGRIRLISDLKPYQIFNKIVRANARHLLGSLLVWIREAGYAGLIVTLNGFRLLDAQRAEDGSVNYTKAALFDAYEVFREFIDSTDTLDGLFLSVFVPPEFLDVGNPRARSLAIYPALLYRVYDELRSQQFANPLTAMTRLSESSEVPA